MGGCRFKEAEENPGTAWMILNLKSCLTKEVLSLTGYVLNWSELNQHSSCHWFILTLFLPKVSTGLRFFHLHSKCCHGDAKLPGVDNLNQERQEQHIKSVSQQRGHKTFMTSLRQHTSFLPTKRPPTVKVFTCIWTLKSCPQFYYSLHSLWIMLWNKWRNRCSWHWYKSQLQTKPFWDQVEASWWLLLAETSSFPAVAREGSFTSWSLMCSNYLHQCCLG